MGKDSKFKVEGAILVLIFVVILFAMFTCEDSNATEFEVGPTLLSGEYSEGGALLLTERIGKFEVGGGYTSKQECHCRWPADLDENIFFQAQRMVRWKKVEAGIGAAYFQNTNRALGKRLTWALSFGLVDLGHFSVQIRHYSNAGSGSPNLGQDMVTVGWRF